MFLEYPELFTLNLFPFLMALGGSYWLSRPGNKLAAVDTPNDRSMHTTPVPRGGGLAVLAPLFLLQIWHHIGGQFAELNITIGLLLVAVVSYIDDRRSLSSRLRLAVHCVAACVLVLPLGYSVVFSIALCLLTVWCINLFNFMDGIDGLAASMGVIGFFAIFYMSLEAGDMYMAAFSSAISFSCLGFLIVNLSPAKIFLGDVGSASLGFLMAVAIVGSVHGDGEITLSFWTALLVFAPFILDATYTVVRRALAGERFWQAHREHVYQRLALRVGARRALFMFVAAMMFAAAGARSMAMAMACQ